MAGSYTPFVLYVHTLLRMIYPYVSVHIRRLHRLSDSTDGGERNLITFSGFGPDGTRKRSAYMYLI